ncbi:MAG TPA: hypothetical protein VGR84_18865 [Candidatus Acidoferrales bacterium]|nr:hypothetical protein [Candidatus Acidoferrales bacterium]
MERVLARWRLAALLLGAVLLMGAYPGTKAAFLNLAQTWTAAQTFTNSDVLLLGSSTGYTTLTSANAGSSNFTLTFPAVTATLATNPPLTTGSSTGNTFTAPAGFFQCTAACTVTPPAPAAGYQFCVWDKPGTAGAIVLGGNTGVFYGKTDFSGYGSSGGTLTSGGANGDKACIIGIDSTHYDTVTFGGTWTASWLWFPKRSEDIG